MRTRPNMWALLASQHSNLSGQVRLSQIIIDVDKDWEGHRICNLGEPVDDYDAVRKIDLKWENILNNPFQNLPDWTNRV